MGAINQVAISSWYDNGGNVWATHMTMELTGNYGRWGRFQFNSLSGGQPITALTFRFRKINTGGGGTLRLYASADANLPPDSATSALYIGDLAGWGSGDGWKTLTFTQGMMNTLSQFTGTWYLFAASSVYVQFYGYHGTYPASFEGTYLDNTAPGTPPWASVSPSLYESGQVSITWGAASDAEGNVTGYRVQYSTSGDGASWSAWNTLGTYAGTSAADTPGIGRGAYEKYRVCAIDAYGVESGYCEANAIRKNSSPTAPTACTAGPTLREGEAITVTWSGQGDADGNIDHFDIEYATRPAGGSYGAWATLGPDTASPYSHTPTLADGTRIKYRIRAVDAFGVASGWKESNEVIQNSSPTAPTTCTATPSLRESGAVNLAWSGQGDADGNIDHFDLEYATRPAAGAYGAWVALGTDTASPFSHTPALTEGTRIKYRIRAVDAMGQVSGWKESNEVTQNSSPTAPTSLTATPSLRESGAVSVTWSGQGDADGNIDHFDLEYCTKPAGGTYGTWVALGTDTASPYSHTPTLADGTRIKYRIRTVDALGKVSGWKESNEVTQNSSPTAPTTCMAGPSLREGEAITVTWSGQGDADGNIDHFDLEYCTKPAGGTYGAWTVLTTDTASPFSHTPALADGTRIKYRIRTVDALGQVSGWKESNEVTQNSSPTAPTSFMAAPTLREGEAVSLTWGGQGDADGNIDHFDLEYCTKPAGGNYGSWATLGTDTASPYSHTPVLADGTRIMYRIRTVDALGQASGWKESNEVVQNSSPTAPTSFTATPSLRESEAISLVWSGAADADGNIAHFELEYATRLAGGAYGSWIALGTDTASPNSHTPALADGTRIKYRIRTVDALGQASGWKESNEVVQNSSPTAPTSFTATPALRESGAVSLTWSGQGDADGNIDHFNLEYCIKPAGGSYGSWTTLGMDTASPYSHTPTLADGTRIRYRIQAVDAMGQASGWKESNEVLQNTAPVTPVILFPGAGKTTFSNQPYVGLSISAEPDAQTQTLFYSVDGGAAQNAGAVTAGTKKLKLPALAKGSRVLRFWLQDSQGAESGVAEVTVTVAENTYDRIFFPGTLLWDEGNSVKHVPEILELKTRVNQMRSYYGLAPISLPYEGTTGSNSIRHAHTWMENMGALYQGLADACAVSGAVAPDRVTRVRNAPSAGVINQVRMMVGSL